MVTITDLEKQIAGYGELYNLRFGDITRHMDPRELKESFDRTCANFKLEPLGIGDRLIAFVDRNTGSDRHDVLYNMSVPMDEVIYCVLSHETGHVAHPEGFGPQVFNGKGSCDMPLVDDLRAECAAWEWSLDRMLIWTPMMYQIMRYALTSHILYPTRRYQLPILARDSALLARLAALENLPQSKPYSVVTDGGWR